MRIRDVKLINNYAKRVIEKDSNRLNTKDWQIIAKDLIPEGRIQATIAKRVVMSNIDKANNRIMQILSENGIDNNKPFELYKKAEKIAEDKENSGDLIKIADRYTELLDLKPQKVTVTEQRKEIDYNNLLPSETKKTVTITKSIDKSVNNTSDESNKGDE